jgi:hypothetical protein
MKTWIILVCMATLLISCGGEQQVVPASAPPATAVVAPAAVALKDIDLEPLLVQSGDLPSGFSGAQIKDAAPPALKDYPQATKAIDQRFQRNNKTAGGVVVLLYDQQSDLDQATALATKASKYSESLSGVGEQAKLFLGTDLLPIRGVTFVRCQAVVDVSMSGVDTREITAYVKRLDKRLQAAVCR